MKRGLNINSSRWGRLGLNLIWDIDNCQDLAKMAGSLWVMQNVEKILNG